MSPRTHVTLIALTCLLAGCVAAPAATSEPAPSPQPSPTSQPSPTTEPTSTPRPTESPTPPTGSTQGETRTDHRGTEQVWVPAGSFQMGTDETTIAKLSKADPPYWVLEEFRSEGPQHEVHLTSGYWIDKYEVTNAAYQAFVDDGGYTTEAYWSSRGWDWLSDQKIDELLEPCAGDGPDLPRVCVTWYEAEAYAAWRGGRLPTEAEWEFAARGPDSPQYPWGNEFDEKRANVVGIDSLTSVGTYPNGVSWVGAHDMAGNAMEWVQDWLDVKYYSSDGNAENPTGPADGKVKIEKGGWWDSNPFVARSAYRHFEDPPTYSDHHIGFRIVTP